MIDTDINWLDGKPATGKFIMQMHYANGGRAYMKNETYEGIVRYYNSLSGCPDIVDAYIYNPQGEIISNRKAA